jgi:diguanylate cyclase (GGDEF)-like protein
MPPPEDLTVTAVLKWIALQTLAVLAMVVPTTWFAANYVYDKIGIIAANDPHRTVQFMVVVAILETLLFCPIMIISFARALARLKRAHEQLETLAATDSLTGLLNRRGFEAAVAAKRERMAPCASSAALVCDIDWFKRANDEYGHDFGDHALSALGAVIAEATKPCGGVAARFGGEEFVVFVAGRTLGQVNALAEALRIDVQNTPIEFEGVRANFTVSIGVAFADRPVALKSLIAHADSNLYEAKRAGRNRVSGAGGAPMRDAA